MQHSRKTDVNVPMDALDHQKCGVALLQISKHLQLLSWHVGQMQDENSREEISRSMAIVRSSIATFVGEAD